MFLFRSSSSSPLGLDSSILHECIMRHKHLANEDLGESFISNPLHVFVTESMISVSLYNSIPVVRVTWEGADELIDLPC